MFPHMASRKKLPAKITNRKTFEAALWAVVEPYANKLAEEEGARARARLSNGRGGGAVVLPPSRVAPVRRDDLLLHLLHRIWLAYSEITKSFETLQNIPVYLRHFPSSAPRRITRLGWVRYHVENYFHESYIFQNRVDAL